MRYFAYGSNMSPALMNERCPGYRFISVARIDDYALAFPLYSRRWRSWVGSLVRQGGALAWGVIYDVSEQDLLRLDATEGVDLGYYQRMPVITTLIQDEQPIGEQVAETYIALKQSRNRRNTPPARRYLDRYVEGSRHWGLPRAWMAYLEDLASEARTTLVHGRR